MPSRDFLIANATSHPHIFAADPHEVRNLASEPTHRTRLLTMRKLVDDWVVATNYQCFRMEDRVFIDQNCGPRKGQ